MALTFGLLAALLWGLSDFLISVSGRSFGVHRAMLYAQSIGVVLVGGWPVWIYYLISASMLGVGASVRRRAMALPMNGAATVAMTGGVAVCGFLALSAGLATGELALVGALTSLQSVVTVCLAGIFHRERLASRQWAGLAVSIAGLVVIHVP